MESIMIGVMIVVMAGLLIFGGHRLMMGGHNGHRGYDAKTPAPAAVTNAVTMPPASAPLRVPTSTGISNQRSQSNYENKK